MILLRLGFAILSAVMFGLVTFGIVAFLCWCSPMDPVGLLISRGLAILGFVLGFAATYKDD